MNAQGKQITCHRLAKEKRQAFYIRDGLKNKCKRKDTNYLHQGLNYRHIAYYAKEDRQTTYFVCTY